MGAPGGSTSSDITDSSRDSQVPPGQAEDQFFPVIAADAVSGFGVVAWYDTADLASTHLVAAMHAQVQPLTAGSLVGNLHLFFPTPTYAFGNDLGLYNGAAPLNSFNKFAVGFVDGVAELQPPTGQGGVYTVLAAP